MTTEPNKDAPAAITDWDIAQAERHYPPSGWRREAIMDLAQFVAEVRVSAIAAMPAASEQEPVREKRPFAYCCAEAGGRVEFCDCVNKNHGTALFEVRKPAPSDQEKLALSIKGHWSDPDPDTVVEYEKRDRASLMHGDMTDFALANRQYMAGRGDLDLVVWQTAAKERIRWLSVQLARARQIGDKA